MKSTIASTWNRVFALLGRVSMYRLVFLALALLAVLAFLLATLGLVSVGWLDILVTAVVLAVVNVAVDAAAQRILRLSWRIESSLITSLILLFVLHPTVQPLGLVGVAIAAAVASLSKYVLAWRGRHIFNPAAVGATVLTLITAITGVFALGTSWWWVGTPILGPVVLLLGIVVLWRIEKLRVVALFWVVALAVGVVNLSMQSSLDGQAPDVWSVLWTQLWSSPLLFLGAFMLSEPLTMPPRRWQQLTVAAIVGVLVGWAPAIGAFPVSLGQERALLIGNLIAFLFAVRTAVRLVLVSRAAPTATVRELTFRTTRPLAFAAGQYIELEVPHRRPDARGTRREFSIVSAPEDLPTLRIAFREGGGAVSSFKKALAEVEPGGTLPVTGVWGDFVLPRDRSAKILLVAAGIGVTPFVSQLRHLSATGDVRDIVLVYVASDASELAFRVDLEASGVRVVAFTRDEPAILPSTWTWAGGTRIDAAGLHREVPDLDQRHAYVSGPAGLIADLAPALEKARSITTDAFSGY
ncbi:MAG: FAD-dependent oxidoreductase [Microbacterium sp.]|uniref:FAD-dependent oxidoreductase n=1 Tax=Microbacterium sp. TaxID=51671 RepID=UPI001AC109B4|nr:FAD-dependent oxidoreductase [Microbacterium sp.]MBN9155724.1 FAD-dependent oxidoreductase [Microbacterium sp.]